MYHGPVAPSLSIVIPVFNEETEVTRILEGALAALNSRPSEWEILVVDNASSDGTRAALEPFLSERVRLLENDDNRGKGYSIRRGMLAAEGELRLMCDADCVDSLSSLARLEAAAVRADVIVGSRSAAGASVARQQPIRRRVVGAGFILASRLVLGPLPRDIYCGFKLWRAEAAEAVFRRAVLDGWAFDAEALALARRLGFSIEEVGIVWRNRPDSRLSIRQALVPVTRDLARARRSVASSSAVAERPQVSQAKTG